MKITVETRSDQFNAQDFLGGPRTFTVESVNHGTGPNGLYDVVLQGESRFWRPPKTVIDVMNALWGDEDTDWMGKRVTLYNEESVSFGKSEVGGIRVCGASGITEPKKFRVKEKKMGTPQVYTVQPISDDPWAGELGQSLKAAWGDVERLAKAVTYLEQQGHPLAAEARTRLTELQGEQ